MEMLFLQSAAGVSSQRITAESLNTLANASREMNVGNSDADSEANTDQGIESHIPFPNQSYFEEPMAPEEVVEILALTENIAQIVEGDKKPGSPPVGDASRQSSVDRLKRTLSAEGARKISVSGGAGKDIDTTIAMSVHLQNTVQLSNVVFIICAPN
jgi:hypothetical protein